MHRLPAKGAVPQCLQNFCRTNPNCHSWDTFYNNNHDSYIALKKALANNQRYLCAYCEEQLSSESPSDCRIEHFHPKEDVTPEHNWAFDWHNMLVTCHGGSREQSQGKADLHCDASKEQMVTPDKCEGYLLNPLTMPNECVFGFRQSTGELRANEAVCSHITVTDNHYASVAELVEKTIEILNLNCPELTRKRRLVLREYEQKRKSMRQNPKTNQDSIRTAIAREWFDNHSPSFYSTRRILLGKYAEDIIARQQYPW